MRSPPDFRCRNQCTGRVIPHSKGWGNGIAFINELNGRQKKIRESGVINLNKKNKLEISAKVVAQTIGVPSITNQNERHTCETVEKAIKELVANCNWE